MALMVKIALPNLVMWSHWSLMRSRTSLMMALMVIMAIWPLIRNLSRARARVGNASLIDLLASTQVKRQTLERGPTFVLYYNVG